MGFTSLHLVNRKPVDSLAKCMDSCFEESEKVWTLI